MSLSYNKILWSQTNFPAIFSPLSFPRPHLVCLPGTRDHSPLSTHPRRVTYPCCFSTSHLTIACLCVLQCSACPSINSLFGKKNSTILFKAQSRWHVFLEVFSDLLSSVILWEKECLLLGLHNYNFPHCISSSPLWEFLRSELCLTYSAYITGSSHRSPQSSLCVLWSSL